MTNVAAYIRQSKKEKRANSYSIEYQMDWIVKRCKERDWPKPNEPPYLDRGVSGDELYRLGLRDMLVDIYEGKLHYVVAFKLDRLARDTEIQSRLMGFFSRYDVLAEFSDYKSDDPKIIAAVLGAVSEQELENTRVRSVAGQDKARKLGKKIGHPPSGFTTNKKDKVGGDKWILSAKGKKILRLLNNHATAEEISQTLKTPLRTVKRITKRIRAWERGGLPALKAMAKESSRKTEIRKAKAKKKLEAQREWFSYFIENPGRWAKVPWTNFL